MVSTVKNPALFYGAIVVAIIAVALAVYYLIPGVYHVLTFSGDPTSAHYKHAAACGAVAIICILAALVNRPKSA